MKLKEAEDKGFYNTGVYLTLKKYLELNGGYDISTAPGDGACFFYSVLSMIDSPQEYTTTHLRRDIVLLAAEYPAYFYKLLEEGIKGTYGFPRKLRSEYIALKKANKLSAADEEDMNMAGPFSFCSYLEHMLQGDTWADIGIIRVMSCLFQNTIAIVTAETLITYRIRNEHQLDEMDMVLIHKDGNHYIPTSKYFFLTGAALGAAMRFLVP